MGLIHLQTPLTQLHVTHWASSCVNGGGHLQLCPNPGGHAELNPRPSKDGSAFITSSDPWAVISSTIANFSHSATAPVVLLRTSMHAGYLRSAFCEYMLVLFLMMWFCPITLL